MKAKKIWANFSVKNVNRTREFYTHLGFTPNKFSNNPQLVSFLFGENDFVIHFFEQGSQIDRYLSPEIQNSEIIFTLSAETASEVKEWSDRVKQAGGTVFNEMSRDDSNYYGFAFADPDGHRFNILLIEPGM
ncbi:VOC family protein [Sphingobacterium spiritivorum]|uniref:VOC family protein n=1 Tax=Sphingobacterium spiritivorum TaxID=258 RepID=UPI003DA3C93F